MTARRGLFVDYDAVNDVGTTPTQARHAFGGAWETNGSSALDVRLGVVADTGLTAVVAGTANMSYDVRAFKAVTALSTANGPTVSFNDATVNVATTNAPGANSRIDVIWCRQHLLASDGGADSDTDFEIGVTQGTPAASPSIPSIPTGALALYYALVPTGVTATNSGVTFTRAHQWTVARGGLIPIFTSDDLATITTPRKGQMIWDEQTAPGEAKVYDGTGWVSLAGRWRSYTPTLTAASSNPTLGTGGSITGQYMTVGKILHWRVKIVSGTTPSVGSGVYRVSVPSTPDAGYYAQGAQLGQMNLSTSGTSGALQNGWFGFVILGSTGAFEAWMQTGQWSHTVTPLSNNTTFWLSGSYAIA